MINRKSRHLVVLVATYDRINLLQRSIEAISRGTRCSHEIIVIDGGSTDGTVEFLRAHESVTAVFQGKLLGTARCYNEVWREVESTYTCWLSDDTEIVDGCLDRAVEILAADVSIGMVGLKMRDTMGPWANEPYVGGRSEYGILNCNHGVLRTADLRSVGYFNQDYRSYMIDPDLCASVLCTGNKVVMTKEVSVLHHREWAKSESPADKSKRDMAGIDNDRIYRQKFGFLGSDPGWPIKLKSTLATQIGRLLFARSQPRDVRLWQTKRDWDNIVHGRYIRLTDSFRNRRNSYHLVQQIPVHNCRSAGNPYQHLVSGEVG